MPSPLPTPSFDGEEPLDMDQSYEHDELSKVQDLIKSLDLSSSTCRIHRMPPGGSEFHYEGEINITGFSLDSIKENYGGGHYRLQFCTGGKYIRTVRFSVRPDVKGRLTSPPEPQTIPGVSTNDNAMFAMLLKSQQDAAAQARQDSQNFMALMMQQQNQQAITQVVQAAMQPRGGGNERIIELILPAVLANRSPNSSLSETITAIKEIRQLQEAEPDPEPEKEDQTMLKTIISTLPTAIGALSAFGRPPQQPTQVQPLPVGPSPEESEIHQRVTTIRAQLGMALPFLVSAAKAGEPVEGYVDRLRTMTDARNLEIIHQVCLRDSWMTDLFQNPPPPETHDWFNRLRNRITGVADVVPAATDASPSTPTKEPGAVQPVPGRRGSTLGGPR